MKRHLASYKQSITNKNSHRSAKSTTNSILGSNVQWCLVGSEFVHIERFVGHSWGRNLILANSKITAWICSLRSKVWVKELKEQNMDISNSFSKLSLNFSPGSIRAYLVISHNSSALSVKDIYKALSGIFSDISQSFVNSLKIISVTIEIEGTVSLGLHE